MKRILLLGHGAREHALAWKYSQSPHIAHIDIAPGNGGTQTTTTSKIRNLLWDGTKEQNWPRLLGYLQANVVDLIVVGPEAPLAWGLVDQLHSYGFPNVLGPSEAATRIESDKFFSAKLMQELHIPQAQSTPCHSEKEAYKALTQHITPQGIVLKTRGLAGGKGVFVCDTLEQAHDAVSTLTERFGPELLVSERLFGQEFSAFALCDGRRAITLPLAIQDYKRRDTNDLGPNTGGMGAYGPVSDITQDDLQQLQDNVFQPIVTAMNERGTPYLGWLYAGCIRTHDGDKILEFNARFGDPECQVAMPLLDHDLFQLSVNCLAQNLPQKLQIRESDTACCLVLASQGYPGPTRSGLPITFQTPPPSNTHVFHAGTIQQEGKLVTQGGRVLSICSTAPTLQQARDQVYKYAETIDVPGSFQRRTDIGLLPPKRQTDSTKPAPSNSTKPEYEPA